MFGTMYARKKVRNQRARNHIARMLATEKARSEASILHIMLSTKEATMQASKMGEIKKVKATYTSKMCANMQKAIKQAQCKSTWKYESRQAVYENVGTTEGKVRKQQAKSKKEGMEKNYQSVCTSACY